METTILPVTGMTCGGCVSSVTRVLSALKGIRHVDVQLAEASAKVDFNEAEIGVEQIKEAIRNAGFETP